MSQPIMTYDDSKLWKLLESLPTKKRLSALKGGFRREANRVRRVAIQNLNMCVNSNPELAKGVRALVWKREAGFRVTVGSRGANSKGKGEQGMYLSHQQRAKPPHLQRKLPILRWLETGTGKRTAKKKTRFLDMDWSTTRNRGYIRRRGFMEQAKTQVLPEVTASLKRNITESVVKTARKYGCK